MRPGHSRLYEGIIPTQVINILENVLESIETGKVENRSMPYIKNKIAKEKDFDLYLQMIEQKIESGGELNYCISMLLALRTKRLIKEHGKLSYEIMSKIYGDACLAAEEYRERVIEPYEKGKRNDVISNTDPYRGIE